MEVLLRPVLVNRCVCPVRDSYGLLNHSMVMNKFRISWPRNSGGKAGKGNNKTSTIRVVSDDGPGSMVIEYETRYNVRDSDSKRRAVVRCEVKLRKLIDSYYPAVLRVGHKFHIGTIPGVNNHEDKTLCGHASYHPAYPTGCVASPTWMNAQLVRVPSKEDRIGAPWEVKPDRCICNHCYKKHLKSLNQ